MQGEGGASQTQADTAWLPAPPACCFNDIETSGNPRPLEGPERADCGRGRRVGWGDTREGSAAANDTLRLLLAHKAGPHVSNLGPPMKRWDRPRSFREVHNVASRSTSRGASPTHRDQCVRECELPTCTAKERVQDTDCCARECEPPRAHPGSEYRIHRPLCTCVKHHVCTRGASTGHRPLCTCVNHHVHTQGASTGHTDRCARV